MESIAPPIDLLSEIPIDVTKEAILNLPYENLLNFCKTNKRYSTICRDSKFLPSGPIMLTLLES